MSKKTLFEKLMAPEQTVDLSRSVSRVIEQVIRSQRILDGDVGAVAAMPHISESLTSDVQATDNYVKHLRKLILRQDPRVIELVIKRVDLSAKQRLCQLSVVLKNEVVEQQFVF